MAEPSSGSAARTRYIMLRVDDDEHAAIERAAGVANKPLGTWCRERALAAARRGRR